MVFFLRKTVKDLLTSEDLHKVFNCRRTGSGIKNLPSTEVLHKDLGKAFYPKETYKRSFVSKDIEKVF